jgi:hypothetical protein
MRTVPLPLSDEERRLLASRVLTPCLQGIAAQRNENQKHAVLLRAVTVDHLGVLALLNANAIESKNLADGIRFHIARRLARDNLEGAITLTEMIASPSGRSRVFSAICDDLPAERRADKLEILQRAVAEARGDNSPERQLSALGEVAERLLDLGDAKGAKALFDEGRPIAEKNFAPLRSGRSSFIIQLARVDPDSALVMAKKLADIRERALLVGNIAAQVALTDPARAETIFDPAIRESHKSFTLPLRVCESLAKSDLSRARRLAVPLDDSSSGLACLVFAARGAAATQPVEARQTIIEALRESDRDHHRDAKWTGRFAMLLPIVEAVDPELVPEFFWRAVAKLGVDDDPRVRDARDDVMRAALLLARYDRDVATALFESALRSSTFRGAGATTLRTDALLALAVIDPARAVTALETMSEPVAPQQVGELLQLRLDLAEHLARTTDSAWLRIWFSFSGLGPFLTNPDVLR